VDYGQYLLETYFPHFSFPLMTLLLVLANVIVYLVMLQWEVDNSCYGWYGT
jgi:hypothetical protein